MKFKQSIISILILSSLFSLTGCDKKPLVGDSVSFDQFTESFQKALEKSYLVSKYGKPSSNNPFLVLDEDVVISDKTIGKSKTTQSMERSNGVDSELIVGGDYQCIESAKYDSKNKIYQVKSLTEEIYTETHNVGKSNADITQKYKTKLQYTYFMKNSNCCYELDEIDKKYTEHNLSNSSDSSFSFVYSVGDDSFLHLLWSMSSLNTMELQILLPILFDIGQEHVSYHVDGNKFSFVNKYTQNTENKSSYFEYINQIEFGKNKISMINYDKAKSTNIDSSLVKSVTDKYGYHLIEYKFKDVNLDKPNMEKYSISSN